MGWVTLLIAIYLSLVGGLAAAQGDYRGAAGAFGCGLVYALAGSWLILEDRHHE